MGFYVTYVQNSYEEFTAAYSNWAQAFLLRVRSLVDSFFFKLHRYAWRRRVIGRAEELDNLTGP